MSVEEYIPEKYITTSEVFDHFGITEAKQQSMTEIERNRYRNWVRKANNRVETELFPDSDSIPLTFGDAIFTYARDAALDWVVYQKRDYAGSRNALSAKNDYDRDIKLAKSYLKRTPTKKNEPIQAPVTTDTLSDFIIPYSQTQGFPLDTLY